MNKIYLNVIFLLLKKTLESLSFERRRGIEEEDGHEEIATLASKMSEAMTANTTNNKFKR